jgi:hypothetical protein
MPARPLRPEIAALLLLGLSASAGVAPDASAGETADLRDLRVGMALADVSPTGYADLTCRDGPPRTLAAWTDWRSCPTDSAGRRAIGFEYAEDTSRNGTRVGGHPARLTLLVTDDARVDGLVIETDDETPLYLRKKAHLLGLQARAHWGEDDWSCVDEKPAGDEAPLGDTFIKQECRKRLPDRIVTVRRELYHHAGQGARAFVSSTQIRVALAR